MAPEPHNLLFQPT